MRSGSCVRFSAFVAVCLLLIASVCRGQVTSATVTGEITEPTGAVLPGVAISMTNLGTGIVSKTVTNDRGVYRISGLVAGVYRANISKPGFKSIVKSDIQLHIADAAAISFVMEVGSVSESVTVEAGAPQIETQSTSLGETIEGRQVQDAPLNARDAMNLISLVPGVVPQGGTAGGNPGQGGTNFNMGGVSNYQIGGGIAGWNATFVDGATVNGTNGNWQALVPTQDAVSEFRVDFNAVTPQYGRYGGGVINFSTRSGTNQFHGTAYEYVRNTMFNAATFYNNRLHQPKSTMHYNQFGATLGGPIIRNKAFFFFSWESNRFATKNTTSYRAPTPAEMSGDFRASGPTYDIKTGARATCNGVLDTFCASQLDATAQAMYKAGYWAPVESDPAQLAILQQSGYNGQVTGKMTNTSVQYVGRVDYQLTDKQRLFARFTYWGVTIPKPSAVATPNFWSSQNVFTDQAVVGDNINVSPTFNVDVRLAFLRYFFDTWSSAARGDYNMAQFGPNWATVGNQLAFDAAPRVSNSSWANNPNGAALVQHNYTNNYSASVNLTKVLGRHSIQFGGEFRRQEFYSGSTTSPGGTFNFSAISNAAITATGSVNRGIANFVEGVSVYQQGTSQLVAVIRASSYAYYQGYYLTDTWKVTPKLTANVGVRWELPGAWMERNDHDSVLLPDKPSPLGSFANPVPGGPTTLMGVIAAVNTTDYPNRTQTENHLHLFEPRVGLNYAVSSKMVFRMGFGLSHPCLDCGSQQTTVSSSNLNSATTLNPSNFNAALGLGSLSNPYPNGVLQPLGRSTRLMEPYSSFPQTLIGASASSQKAYGNYPYVMQWNAGVERAFGSSTSALVSYGGSRGVHLGAFDINLNQLPDKYDSLGPQLLTQVTNPFKGIATPSGAIGGTTAAYGRFLMPYPQFTQLIANGLYYGETSYNSLIGQLRQKISSSSVRVSYTFAHLISNVDSANGYLEAGTGQSGLGYVPQNYNNLSAERSNSGADIRQRLAVEYILDMPFGKNRLFLATANPILDHIVSGWALTGITGIQTGLPIGLTTSRGNVLTSQFGAGTLRPNVIAGVNKKTTDSRYDRTLPGHTWFNTAAFSAPASDSYTFGNESRLDSVLRADNIHHWDVGLSKNTQINERFSLQLRAEFFNVFNRPQFGFAASGVQAGSTTFGTVSSQVNQARVGQFSIRLNY